jgi:hypothetical protein
MNRGVDAYADEVEHTESQLPLDADKCTAFAFARLRYASTYESARFYSWGIDAPDMRESTPLRRTAWVSISSFTFLTH